MILYKYFPPNENSFKSLVNSGLWCDKYTNMNDPFESLAVIERKFTSSEIEEFRTYARASKDEQNILLAELDDDSIGKFINEIRTDILKDSYYFASLSERCDNILLWSHYCANHTGFVLAIELDENDSHIQKVNYKNNLPAFDMKWFFNLKDTEKTDSAEVSYLLKDFAIKSEHWNYEEEWRINRKKRGYRTYKPEQLKAIYFGLNTDVEIIKIVAFLSSVHNDNIPIYKMELTKNPMGLKPIDYEYGE